MSYTYSLAARTAAYQWMMNPQPRAHRKDAMLALLAAMGASTSNAIKAQLAARLDAAARRIAEATAADQYGAA